MKSKFFKSALALTSALSLSGINMFSAVAKNLDTTGLETEYEMLELERTKPGTNLIKNGGFETNKGQYWSTTGDGKLLITQVRLITVKFAGYYHHSVKMHQYIKHYH